MILYKYYDAEGGRKALESRRLGFCRPSKFNDPFELTALSNCEGPASKLGSALQMIDGLRERVVILCLTRSPMNPLMWAHYGKAHTGLVIGYDVSGDFLNSEKYNLVPANTGEVVYTHTKSPFKIDHKILQDMHQIYLLGAGDTCSPSYEQQAFARRLFLTKHATWVYEEEVRVVKIVDSVFEETHVFQADPLRSYDLLSSGLHLYTEQAKIDSVFFGARSSVMEDDSSISEVLKNLHCSVYKLEVDSASWQLVKRPFM